MIIHRLNIKDGTTFEWIATAENGWHAIVVNAQIGWVSGKYSEVTYQQKAVLLEVFSLSTAFFVSAVKPTIWAKPLLLISIMLQNYA